MIDIAIVGFGHIALKHKRALVELDKKYRITQVVEPYEIDLKQFPYEVKRHQYIKDLDFNNLDCVVISSPSNLHFDHTQQFVNEDIKIICEKPVSLEMNSLQKIKQNKFYEQNVTPFLMAQYSPAVEQLKEIFKGNSDEIEYILVRMPWRRDADYFAKNNWRGSLAGDGGILLNQAIHYLDIIDYVFGDLSIDSVVGASLRGYCSVSDRVFVNATCKKCARVIFDLSTAEEVNLPTSIECVVRGKIIKLSGNHLLRLEVGSEIYDYSETNLFLEFYKRYSLSHSDISNMKRHIKLLEKIIPRIK
jgi:UDP-N-acetyl-2-amino-2-deoxyglucuronate dehydrogenase